ncbi:MAG TPA: DUF6799 domain-containing protein [Flavobacteriales bacterium]|nr:DUF6799 domain-containing protein [Flavobacteriales bacterium]
MMIRTLMIALTTLYIVKYELPQKIEGRYEVKNAGNEIYCAATVSGHTVVICEGNTVTENVTLQNGKTLTPEGVIIDKDGTRTQMQPGECIGKDGKPRTGKDRKPKE